MPTQQEQALEKIIGPTTWVNGLADYIAQQIATGGSSNVSIVELMATLNQGPGSNVAISYVPSGHTFGRLISSSPATLGAYFGSLGAAQAVYSFATSLTNYADRCAAQLALNQCTANGGGICQFSGVGIYLDTSLTWDPSLTTLNGIRGPTRTRFLTEACGSSPAFAVAVGSGLNLNGGVGFSNVDLLGKNAGASAFPQSGSGVANTGYRVGGIALSVTNCANGVLAQNVNFYNFDTPHVWAAGENIYCLTFLNCVYEGNNYGPNAGTVSAPAPVSAFERMIWIGGTFGNNNYGYCFNMGANSGSIFLLRTSIDYNIVRAGWYDGLGGGGDCQLPLFLDVIHNESNGATSGYTVCPFYNNGTMFLSNIEGYWNDGTNPIGWVEPGSTSASTNFSNCMVPGVDSGVPAVYTAGSSYVNVTASGLSCRYYAQGVPLSRTTAGITMFQTAAPTSQSLSGAFLVSLGFQTTLVMLSGVGTITVDLDTASDPFLRLPLNHVIGAKILFVTTDTSTQTFVAQGGVTIASVGAGLTFGGAPGKIVALIKAAANTWLACGDMT